MNNGSDANSALIEYFETLLVDGDAAAEAAAVPVVSFMTPEGDGSLEVAPVATELNAARDVLRVLFFKVAGIPLAVSLEDITGVVDIKQTALRQKSLEGGRTIRCFSYRGRDIYTLDTRETILPHGHPARSDADKTACQHIVMLAGCECGLLCDEVGGIVNLNRGEIEWREQRQTRPWLAGMVKGYNHAYMDIKEFIGACDQAFSSTH